MAFFPTVPEPERAYLERASKTQSERKFPRAIAALVRHEDDPKVEIRKVDDAESRQRYLYHLGSKRQMAPTVAVVADELSRARVPAGTEFRSGLFLLAIGGAIAVISAFLVAFVGGVIFYITWLIGTLVGVVGFERASERYLRHETRFLRGEYGPAAAEDVLVRHEKAEPKGFSYVWWMGAGALIGIPSIALSFPLGWVFGSILGIVGLVKIVRAHTQSLVEKSRLAYTEQRAGSTIESMAPKPIPKPDRRVRGYHWFFIIGFPLALISAFFSFYIGVIVGVIMAISSVVTDSEWL